MDRREFLSTASAIGGAMVLGFWLPPSSAEAQSAAASGSPWYREALVPEINAWITIAPDDTVTIRVSQIEMGQGVFTSGPMIVAEELQCDWNKIRAEYASANRNVREKAPAWTLKVPDDRDLTDPAGGSQRISEDGVYRRLTTNSSSSVRRTRYYLQLAGAEARERLLLAAATMWGVPASELVAKDSVITHARTKRRTTYGAEAARAARVQLPVPSRIRIKTPDQWTLMGTERKSLTTPLMVTGQAMYAVDVRLPGMLYAAAKACPVWGGDVKSYDFARIRTMPGVHSAVRVGGPGHLSGGVAVVADSWWHAKTALEALPIEWDYGPHARVNSASLLEGLMAAFKQPGKVDIDHGNVDAGMERAARVVEATYRVPYLAHACMEPGCVTAIVTPDRVDLWTGSQQPDRDLLKVARGAGIAPENVFIHQLFLGGGYGITNEGGGLANESTGRSDLNLQAVAIAKTLNGRPVKLLWSREEDWGFGVRPRWMGVGVFRAGLDAAGWPIALDVRSAGYDVQTRGLTNPPYFVPNYRYTAHDLPKEHVPCIQRRATGSSINCFYLESFIEELAHAAGKDPYLYRRELIARNPAPPQPGIGGFSQRDNWLKALDMVTKMAGWGTPLPEGWARGLALDDRRRASDGDKYTTVVAQVHTLEVNRRGQLRLHRVDMVFDEGFGFVNPLAARRNIEGQIAWGYDDTMYQAVTIRDGRAVEVNFDTYPISRMNEYPREVNIAFFKTNKWIYGIGEEAIPEVAPAICNAVFKITGKRIRSLPLKNHDLSWG
jgi:isoquinoline 1-oxidoreductase beta subunit